MTAMPMIGQDFGGYRVEAVLGRGGMSVVYRAQNARVGNFVALKVLASELATDDAFRARFLQESRMAASLSHPNVIPIYDSGPIDDLLYISMRYVSGADLRRVLKTRSRLAPETALPLIAQTGRALDAAHRAGLVHRDVKPGNILIERGSDDEPDHVYLADFGITKHTLSISGLTSTGHFVGTLDYIAPEQIQGKAVDARTDIYSLGCVLYESLTGRVPFQKDIDAAVIWAHVEETPEPPSALCRDLSPALDDVILRALAKDPNERFGSCREFLTAAQDAVGPQMSRTVMASDSDVAAVVAPTVVPAAADLRPGSQEPTPAASYPSERSSSALRPVPPPPPASAGPGGENPPPDEPGSRGPRSWFARPAVWAAAVAVIIAGVAAWALSAGGSSASPGTAASHQSAAAMSHSSTAQSSAMSHSSTASSSAMPASMTTSTTTGSASASSGAGGALMRAAVTANQNSYSRGLLPPSSCTAHGMSMLMCKDPTSTVSAVSFQTLPSLQRLYAVYEADARSLSGEPFKANFNDCTEAQSNGEVSWNHASEHSRLYSVAQLASGRMNVNLAFGRVFCTFSPSGDFYIVWTDNPGRLLGVVTGDPHDSTWDWWHKIHHTFSLVSGGAMSMGG